MTSSIFFFKKNHCMFVIYVDNSTSNGFLPIVDLGMYIKKKLKNARG